MAEDISTIITRVKSGSHTDEDIQTLILALQSGQSLAWGDRSIALSSSANDSVNVTGDNNKILIRKGATRAEIRQELLVALAQFFDAPRSTPELSPEELRSATLTFLQDIENKFKETRLFHTKQPIMLQDQYVPIQVTLEPHRRDVETLRGYWETEEELKRAYALKGGEEKAEEELKRQQMDWSEAKQKHQRLMVLADPGMGKSTLLRMEGGTTAEREGQRLERDSTAMVATVLPLFLRLSELAKDAGDLVEAIPRLIGRDYPRTAPVILPLLTEKLKAGQCLLLLDALDEVPKNKRLELKEKLDRFVGNYPCPVICTSRIVGYDGNFLADGQEAEIVPFQEPQIKQYVTTWFTNAAGYLSDPSVSAAALLRELRSKPQVRGLVQNPLLLALICSLYQEKGLTLPARRVQVYEQAVEYMLEQWSQTRQSRFPGKAKAKTRLLEALAYHFSCEDREVFGRDDLYDWMENYLDTDAPRDLRAVGTEELIAELSEADGILQKLSPESDQYLFLHRTFQEYLTASYLARAKDGIALAKAHVWEYDWHETISLMAGLMKPPLALLQAITDEKDDIFQTQLLLAGRCLGECEATSYPLIAEVIERIYQFWLTYPNYEFIRLVVVTIGRTHTSICEQLQTTFSDKNRDTRWKAAEILGQIGSNKSIDKLITAVSDEDSDIRLNSVGALERIGDDKAVNGLIIALNDDNSDVRWNAVETLGKIGSDKAINGLIAILNDENSEVRGGVAEALGKIGSDEAVADLIAALKDENSEVRGSVAEALGKIGSDEAVADLVVALKDESSDVRGNAAEALGRICCDKAIDGLIAALNDNDSYVRWKAVEALEEIGSDKAVDGLITALNDHDNEIVSKAAEALGQIGGGQALDSLISILNCDDSEIRDIAVEALSHGGIDEAINYLINLLDNDDGWVRGNAAETLGKIGSDKAVDSLVTAINDENTYVRENAAEALGKIGSNKAVPGLIIALNDNDSDVRWNAVEALGKIDSEESVDHLINALNDDISGVRWKSAEVLGQIGSDKAIDHLITALNDEVSDVRSRAAEALGRIRGDKAVDHLITTLNDEVSDVRLRAAEALGRIRSDKAVNRLIAALNDEASNVRGSAAESLGQIGSNDSIDHLIITLRDKNSYVRGSAAKALGQIGNNKAIDGLITVLNDEASNVRQNTTKALGKINSPTCLEKLIQSPQIDIYRSDIFFLARSLAIRFHKADLPFIPVYPERVMGKRAGGLD